MATSTGGEATGEGGDIVIIDDPIKPKEANSEIQRQNANDFFDFTLYSRLNDHRTGLFLVIMQRLHEEDLCGHLDEKMGEDFETICIPGELSDDVSPKSLRKFYRDGLFDPTRFSRDILKKHKITLLDYGYSGQIQQRPAPDVGGLFKKYNWCFWIRPGQNLPPPKFRNEKGEVVESLVRQLPGSFEDEIQAWDMSFSDTEDSSFVSGGHLTVKSPNFYLVDEVHRRMDYPATVQAVKEFYHIHPRRSGVFVEEKANGPAVIADLKRTFPSIIPVKAETDKVTRAMPLCRAQTARNVFLPHPHNAPWVDEFIQEFANFPKGKYDDRVDMMAHGFNELSKFFEYSTVEARI